MIAYCILGTGFILACAKAGDWRNWKQYYPTILFFMFGSIFFDVYLNAKPLWIYYTPEFNDPVIDLVWVIAIFPSTALIFLYHMPYSAKNKMLYIAFWVLLYVAIELALYFMGYFVYCNKWNIICSFLFDCCLFSLLYIHHKSPIAGWMLSVVFTTIIMIVFKINFLELK